MDQAISVIGQAVLVLVGLVLLVMLVLSCYSSLGRYGGWCTSLGNHSCRIRTPTSLSRLIGGEPKPRKTWSDGTHRITRGLIGGRSG
jgi:hypothetical protein